LDRVGRALRVGGALLASFKYGAGEVVRDGRLFNSYDEGAFQALVAGHPLLAIASLWTTQDARPSRAGERWLNVLATRSR
ncbi:MAG: hypothetical protein RLZZ387_79, partial [Chloroflexota bacterium]